MGMESNTAHKCVKKQSRSKLKSKRKTRPQRELEVRKLSMDHQKKYPVSNREILKYLDHQRHGSFISSNCMHFFTLDVVLSDRI